MVENNYQELFNKLNNIKDDNQYLNEFINLVSNILYQRDTFVKNSNNNNKRNKFYDTLKEIILEIYNDHKDKTKQNIKIYNYIEYIGSGHTSLVFRIGDNALKISKEINNRNLFKVPQSNCLIPIFLRKSFKIDEKEHYTLELSPLVDTKNIKEEDVYNAYKKLRDIGYIWNDPLPENIGIITKDLTFKEQSYKKGDIVIIDLEDLAYVGEMTSDDILDELSMMSYNRNSYIYEMKYIKEKGKNK